MRGEDGQTPLRCVRGEDGQTQLRSVCGEDGQTPLRCVRGEDVISFTSPPACSPTWQLVWVQEKKLLVCPTSLSTREDTLALALCVAHMAAWAWRAAVQFALGLRRSKSVAVRVRGSGRTAGSVQLKETSVFYLLCKNLREESAGDVLVVETPIDIYLLACVNTTSNASVDS